MTLQPPKHELSIWVYAFGYFACYAPYSALTKVISQGRLPGMTHALTGFEILPVTTIASLCGMLVFMIATGWWKLAGRRTILGASVLSPGRWTFLSGLCTAAIIGTTTLAYTFSGVSIVFMMLLMRGGVLVIAPVVDAVSRRKVRWSSWAALLLCLGALLVALSETKSYELTLIAAVDVIIYLASYFVRLRFMSRIAKSERSEDSIRYFVEEQMVATPAIVLTLVLLALFGEGSICLEIRRGFTGIATSGAVLGGITVGLLSQGTGVFGGLILLDRRENTFCVPVNRASSVLAGLLASVALMLVIGAPPVPPSELTGAGMVIAAIALLSLPSVLGKRRDAGAGQQGEGAKPAQGEAQKPA